MLCPSRIRLEEYIGESQGKHHEAAALEEINLIIRTEHASFNNAGV